MKVRFHWTVRLRRLAARTGKKARRHLASFLISLAAMLVFMDVMGIFYGEQTASDIAARAAVVAAQVLQRGGDRALAESEALAMTERSLARFEEIRFGGSHDVEVTVLYEARTVLFKHVVLINRLLTIRASGVYRNGPRGI